jgi:hypothetical protein
MFYGVLLTMAADAILVELVVRQLASWKPFEGKTQYDAVRTLCHLCKFAAAKLRIGSNKMIRFYIDSHLFKTKIITIRQLILKI